MSADPDATGPKFWVEAWDAWPRVCDTEEDALADGEASRGREIARLKLRIEHVRTAPLKVVRYEDGQ